MDHAQDLIARQPGGLARRAFNEARRRSLRNDRWLLLSLSCISVAAVFGALLSGGWPGEVWAFTAGVGTATLFFWWVSGGRASSATWLRGIEGERLTGQVLDSLDPEEWACLHDVPRVDGGNWDHVVVGPPGVILLDSKNWGGMTRVLGDELVSGNMRHRGVASRGSAAALGRTIEPLLGRRPWVEPAVVVWGKLDCAQKVNGVTYLPGDALRGWLTSLPRSGATKDSRDEVFDTLLRLGCVAKV